MSRDRRQRAAIRELAARRVEAAWTCVGVLCPDLPLRDRKVFAEKVLDLCRGETEPDPRITISPAQVTEMVWRNMQCINRHCPMLLFSDRIAVELNEFFREEN